jgi:hypothetical protein
MDVQVSESLAKGNSPIHFWCDLYLFFEWGFNRLQNSLIYIFVCYLRIYSSAHIVLKPTKLSTKNSAYTYFVIMRSQ